MITCSPTAAHPGNSVITGFRIMKSWGHGNMKEESDAYKERLMAWEPGADGFSHDDLIVAVGIQCSKKRFTVKDVLQWLGCPVKSGGDLSGGQLVYFCSHDFWGAPMFYVTDGLVTDFGVVSINKPNAKRVDPNTGSETLFNILDEMEPFNEAAFK